MGKQKQKKAVFNPNHRIHFLEIATSPLGKRLSRVGYTDDKHMEAMLYLFGFDIQYEVWEELLGDGASLRSDYTKDVFTGGSLFVGVKRSDFSLANLHKYVYGDGVGEMFDLICNKK